MCGRFNQSSPPEEISRYFSTVNTLDYQQSYNVAPSMIRPVVRLNAEHRREMALHAWGLVPSWVKDTKIAPINAKAETVSTKPFFRQAYQKRRCIIPINGFYEWQGQGGQKTPYYISPRTSDFFGLAGLWESREYQGKIDDTFTIITTEANSLMSPIHARMPVILNKRDYSRWLNTGDLALLCPYRAERMALHPVSRRVNSPRNDTHELLSPVSS